MNSYEKLGRAVIAFMVRLIGIYAVASVVFTLCEAALGGGMTARGNVVWAFGVGLIGGLASGVASYVNS